MPHLRPADIEDGGAASRWLDPLAGGQRVPDAVWLCCRRCGDGGWLPESLMGEEHTAYYPCRDVEDPGPGGKAPVRSSGQAKYHTSAGGSTKVASKRLVNDPAPSSARRPMPPTSRKWKSPEKPAMPVCRWSCFSRRWRRRWRAFLTSHTRHRKIKKRGSRFVQNWRETNRGKRFRGGSNRFDPVQASRVASPFAQRATSDVSSGA